MKRERVEWVDLICLSVIMLVGGHRQVRGQTILFDDFSNPEASAAIWTPSTITPYGRGGFEFLPGEGFVMTLTSSSARYIDTRAQMVDALEINPTDVSMRARVRKIQPEPGWASHLGFAARIAPDRYPPGSEGVDGFFAGILADGTLYVDAAGRNNVAYELDAVDFDVSQEDVMIRLNVVGDYAAFWAWQPDLPMPSEPQITLVDDSFDSGWIGFWAQGGPINSPNEFAQAIYRWVEVVEIPPGDLSHSGLLDVEDIDLLTGEALSATPRLVFDLNGDGAVSNDDRIVWVEDLKKTYFGDADLDGEFNSDDFVQAFQAGKYETKEYAGWSEGDWNGDGLFDSADFVIAFQDGGYEMGPRTDAAAVPEPSGVVLMIIGLLTAFRPRNRNPDVMRQTRTGDTNAFR